MATATLPIVSDDGLTVTVSYDDVTLAWASVAVVNTNPTRTFTFTATDNATGKNWSFTVPPGTNTSHAVPSRLSLSWVADTTVTPPTLSQNAFTLTVT